MDTPANSEAEERIAALEKRIRDMEALVRGLTAELLDLKKVTMGMQGQGGERSRQQLKKGTVVRGTITPEPESPPEPPAAEPPVGDKIVIRSKGAGKQDEPAAPAVPAAPSEPMVRIMQPDGTFKLEPRRGNRKMI